AALVRAGRATSCRIRRPWRPGPVADVRAVCVVAHLATLRVLMLTGLEAGPWALPANIAVAPVVPVVTVLGTLAAAIGPAWEGGAVHLAAACAPSLWWLDLVSGVAAELPGSPRPEPAGPGGEAARVVSQRRGTMAGTRPDGPGPDRRGAAHGGRDGPRPTASGPGGGRVPRRPGHLRSGGRRPCGHPGGGGAARRLPPRWARRDGPATPRVALAL